MSVVRSYLGAFSGQQYQAMIALDQHLDSIANGGGQVPRFVDDPNQQPVQSSPPPAASLDVRGIDGKFRWMITNPQDVNPQSVAQMRAQLANGMNLAGVTILHNVQSATDTNFNNSSNIVDYGITSQVFGQDQKPNETRFFRIRSSSDGQNFNDWQIFSSATVCGPVAVQSGFLRSTSESPNSPGNNSNNATVDSIDAGANATIRSYGPGGVGSSWTRFDGQSGQTLFNGTSILGAAYTTFFTVMYSSQTSASAFPNASQYTSTLPDGLFFAGQTKTVAAGGGGAVPGGGGNSGGGGTTGGAGGGGRNAPDRT